jgi:hypothetical protein
LIFLAVSSSINNKPFNQSLRWWQIMSVLNWVMSIVWMKQRTLNTLQCWVSPRTESIFFSGSWEKLDPNVFALYFHHPFTSQR